MGITVELNESKKFFRGSDRELIYDIEEMISETNLRINKLKSRYRTFIVTGILTGMVSVTAGITTPSTEIILLGTMYGVFIGLGGWFLTRSQQDRLEAEIERLHTRKRIVEQFHADTPPQPDNPHKSYFDSLVKINVDNLDAYYTMVKVHTQNSFRISIAAGGIGFLLITTGLVLGFGVSDSTQTASYIAAGAGVITEFIAGVFFYLYNRTVRQLKGYHDSLLAVQNILLSFKILDDIKDETVKVQMVGQMMAFLMNKSPVPLVPQA